MELIAIRRVILGVLLLGMSGLLAELSLLAHYEDIKQWIPLVLLAAGLVALALDLIAPRRWTRTLFIVVVMLVVGRAARDLLSLPGQPGVPARDGSRR